MFPTRRADADRCPSCSQLTDFDSGHECGSPSGLESPWTVGRCATCRVEKSIGRVSRECTSCTSRGLRAYFASPEARAIAASILGPVLAAKADAATSALVDAPNETRRAA